MWQRKEKLAPVADCVEWTRLAYRNVGGLTDVGFSEDEAYLLVASHAGRGLFETATGEKVARDDEAPVEGAAWLRTTSNEVQGIGPLAGVWFSMAGLFGGELPQATSDGWRVSVEDGKATQVILESQRGERWLLDTPITEVKAVGFSKSGHLLVIGTSTEVVFFKRET